MTRIYRLSTGGEVRLGAKLGDGGEGAVWQVEGRPGEAAKIYHQRHAKTRKVKIEAMVRVKVSASIAWPTAALYSRSSGFAGFLMPRVPPEFKASMMLYSQGYRRTEFPRADWRHLCCAAENVARAVATLHAAGQVIGDINSQNILAKESGRVWLIDADSFSFRDRAGRVFPCTVGVQEFVAPELQGVALSSVERTAHQDVFSMAVMIFQLLFLGRHPFAGDHGSDISLGEAIKRRLFAFSPRVSSRPPPLALSVQDVGPQLASLFEATFLPTTPASRPSAGQWVDALGSLRRELKPCPRSSRHHYLGSLTDCPWCEFAAEGIEIFGGLGTHGGSGRLQSASTTEIWSRILGIQQPTPPKELQSPVRDLPRSVHRVLAKPDFAILQPIGIGAAVLGTLMTGDCGGGVATAGAALLLSAAAVVLVPHLQGYSRSDAEQIQQLHTHLRGSDAAVREKWRKAEAAWQEIMDRLEAARRTCLTAKQVLATRLKQAEKDAASRVRQRALESRVLGVGDVKGIGSGRLTTLRSYGIETAWDVLQAVGAGAGTPSCPRCGAVMVMRKARRGRRRGSSFWGCSGYPACYGTRPASSGSGGSLRQVPGIGSAYAGRLTSWARACDSSLRIRVTPETLRQERTRVTQELNDEVRAAREALGKGPAELRSLKAAIEREITSLVRGLHKARQQFEKAL